MFIALQISLLVAVAAYLLHWRANRRRRSVQSWDSLLARLRPNCSARELSDDLLFEPELKTTLVEKWRRLHASHGLWAMFQNAGVMLEMADYAARNSDSIDGELLAAFRSDAMQTRMGILTLIVDYGFSAASDSVGMAMLRSESAFAEMQLRMTELLQTNAAELVPDFVAAV